MVVFDGETINLPHLVGKNYRLHMGMIAGILRAAVSVGPVGPRRSGPEIQGLRTRFARETTAALCISLVAG